MAAVIPYMVLSGGQTELNAFSLPPIFDLTAKQVFLTFLNLKIIARYLAAEI